MQKPILRAPRGSPTIQRDGNYLETMTSEEWLSGFSEVLSEEQVGEKGWEAKNYHHFVPSTCSLLCHPLLHPHLTIPDSIFQLCKLKPTEVTVTIQSLSWLAEWMSDATSHPRKAQQRRQLAFNFQWYSKDLWPLNIRVCSYQEWFPTY